MRIGLVVERFDPARGGREQWTYAFAAGLAALGHEVHVAARDFAPAARRLPIAIHPIVCEKWPLAFAEAAEAVVAPLTLDVVHDMGPGWHCDVFQPHGGSLAALAECKLRALPPWLRWIKRQVNGWLPRHRRFRDLMAKQYADHGQIVLAMSRSAADNLRRYHGVAAERIRVIYNGADTNRFSPEQCAARREAARRRLPIDSDTVLALIVAHNFQLKGVPTLLCAMTALTAEGLPLHLAVVGGKHVEGWRRRAKRLGLGQAVTFVESVEDPLPYYAAADVYVHPTFYDPCSLVVLEAAACGLPVVTSRYNGAAELFHGGGARVLDDPADHVELAAAMRSLMEEPLRRRMGAAARQIMLAHSFDRNVEEILEVYREILARRGGLPRGYQIFQARIAGSGPAAVRTGRVLGAPRTTSKPGVLP